MKKTKGDDKDWSSRPTEDDDEVPCSGDEDRRGGDLLVRQQWLGRSDFKEGPEMVIENVEAGELAF